MISPTVYSSNRHQLSTLDLPLWSPWGYAAVSHAPAAATSKDVGGGQAERTPHEVSPQQLDKDFKFISIDIYRLRRFVYLLNIQEFPDRIVPNSYSWHFMAMHFQHFHLSTAIKITAPHGGFNGKRHGQVADGLASNDISAWARAWKLESYEERQWVQDRNGEKNVDMSMSISSNSWYNIYLISSIIYLSIYLSNVMSMPSSLTSCAGKSPVSFEDVFNYPGFSYERYWKFGFSSHVSSGMNVWLAGIYLYSHGT